jgi:hypothetical protein
MKAGLINHYNSNNYVNRDSNVQKNTENGTAQKINKQQETAKSSDVNGVNGSGRNYNKIITKQERQFFVKMFPESKEQIENHVLFNRNGKVSNTNLYKGSLVDGKV